MKGYKHFIVHIPKEHNDTFKMESGVELHLDKRWTPVQLSNVLVTVSETPFKNESEVEVGYQLFLDPSIFMSGFTAKGQEHDNPYLIDREKKLYKVDPSLIIAYRKNKETEWTGFRENCLGEKIILEQPKKTSSIILLQDQKPKEDKFRLKLTLLNNKIKEQGVNEGDIVFIHDNLMIEVWLEGKKQYLVRNREITAKQLESFCA